MSLFGRQISNALRAEVVSNGDDGQGEHESSTFTLQSGEDTVCFAIQMGAIAAGATNTIQARSSADDVTFSDLTGASIAVADDDDDKLVLVEVTFPAGGDPYHRVAISRGGGVNTEVKSIVALAGGGPVPKTHDATVLSVAVVTPAKA